MKGFKPLHVRESSIVAKAIMKEKDYLSIGGFVVGLGGLILPPSLSPLAILLALAATVLGAIGLVKANGEKTVGRKFAIFGLVLGIWGLLVGVSQMNKTGDSGKDVTPTEQNPKQVAEPPPTDMDLDKAKNDLKHSRDELKKTWRDVKEGMRKGFRDAVWGESSIPDNNKSSTVVIPEGQDTPVEKNKITVGELTKEIVGGMVSEKKQSQLKDVAEAAKLFMSDEQKSKLQSLKAHATELVEEIDRSMSEKDKEKLMKLKKGAVSAGQLYKEYSED